MNSLYEKIGKQYDEMSKTQKRVADYILENRVGVSFLNVRRLAKAAEVSEASVVRFANFMGFEGYTQMQQQMQENARSVMGTKERLTLSYRAYEDREQGVSQVFKEEMEHISGTLDSLDMDMFFQIVDAMADAGKIYIVCGRSALSLGLFLEYYLKLTMDQVYLISDVERNEGLLGGIEKQDLVLALSFKRYTKRTVDILQYISKKKCRIAAITDSLTSPLLKYTHYYLLTQTQMSTYLDSFVAPLTVINALLVYVGKTKNKQLEQRFSQLENIWEEMDIFIK